MIKFKGKNGCDIAINSHLVTHIERDTYDDCCIIYLIGGEVTIIKGEYEYIVEAIKEGQVMYNYVRMN